VVSLGWAEPGTRAVDFFQNSLANRIASLRLCGKCEAHSL